MPEFHSTVVIGFHSCDRDFGLRLLNDKDELQPSDNLWDWLGPGSYFWEQDPARGLEYAINTSTGKQKNKLAAKTPFVIGAIIELGNCLNLVESTSLDILSASYEGLKQVMDSLNQPMPVNKGKNRALDCAVIKYIHQSNKELGMPQYDTIRCAFPEGEEVYPGAMISSRLHIQLCVCNQDCIKGYFLPRPVKKYNPHLK